MKTVGIIAGNGRFPILAAKQAAAEGFRVVTAGMEKEADPELESCSQAFKWVKIGQLGKLRKFFEKEGVTQAIMAGKIEKVRLFQENVSPDLEMVGVIMKTRDFKDDSLLGAISDHLTRGGIEILDSTIFSAPYMPGEGILGKHKASPEVHQDIQFGFEMAKAIAGLDIGQTVVVKKKAVLAVEAIEGTDMAIRRAAELGREKIVVVKVSKPSQDMRFDVPAIGLNTIRELVQAKASALAFEARKTIFIEMDEVIREADKHKIALIGISEDEKDNQ